MNEGLASHINEGLLYRCLRVLFPNEHINVNARRAHGLRYRQPGDLSSVTSSIPSPITSPIIPSITSITPSITPSITSITPSTTPSATPMNPMTASIISSKAPLISATPTLDLSPTMDSPVMNSPVMNSPVDSAGKSGPWSTYLELDVWIPALYLAFEFQDSYHYVTTWYKQCTQDFIQQTDNLKYELVHNNGIDLVTIPCWWDGNLESLAATINHYRPDVLVNYKHLPLISLNPEPNFFPNTEIPTVGQLMLASFADYKVLASREWWIGEKYDGVRCHWNPFSNIAYSRQGRYIHLLPSVARQMPSINIGGMDCELWYGRGNFALSYSLINNTSLFWDHFRISAFDVSFYKFHPYPFEDRYSHLLYTLPLDHPFITVVSRMRGEGTKHVQKMSRTIIERGGEGVMLRAVGSLYENGKSLSLLKMKATIGDKEAVVVAIEKDGGLKLKLPIGKIFMVPRQDVHLPKNPTVGEVVSFSYEENARRDTPIRPRVFRVRSDISWDDLVRNAISEKQIVGEKFEMKPSRYWTFFKLRKLLEEYATSLNLSPLRAETWYNITSSDLQKLNSKGSGNIFQKFKGGYIQAIQTLFPEIQFDKTKFQGVWLETASRREFFINYARKHGFDPLVSENWYTQRKKSIVSEKGGRGVLYYYDFKLWKALLALFPEIGISKLNLKPRDNWKEERNRRAFFENYAKDNGFDPLIAENWLGHTTRQILQHKGASAIKGYYSSSIRKALVSLFPDIGLATKYHMDNANS